MNAVERLRARKPIFGLVQTVPVPTVTELAVWSGYDFVMLDCEHGVIDEAAQLTCLQALTGTDAFAAVRVRRGDLDAVGRYLNLGAAAILMPDVQTATEAAECVAAAAYGPKGTRSSTGAARVSRYGLTPAGQTEPLLFAMIEGARGVANAAAIAATPGIHGLLIGPSDLSADLDCADNLAAPAYVAAFTQVEQVARHAGLLLGTRPHAGFPVERLLSGGHCFIIGGADITVLRDGFRSQLAALRGNG